MLLSPFLTSSCSAYRFHIAQYLTNISNMNHNVIKKLEHFAICKHLWFLGQIVSSPCNLRRCFVPYRVVSKYITAEHSLYSAGGSHLNMEFIKI